MKNNSQEKDKCQSFFYVYVYSVFFAVQMEIYSSRFLYQVFLLVYN